jgi:NDP-sugar pyrophosphorylase family protein
MSDALFPVAVLAGGLGTRLRPWTESIPKALVDVNGEPFLAHQLRLLASRGVRRVVLCIGYKGEMIRNWAGDGSRFGVRLEYSEDGPVLLGTAGAVRKALPMLGERFFVLYGDSYLPCDYRAVQQAFLAAGKPALMTVYRNEGRWDQSNVEFHAGRILAYDKRRPSERMRHIDYGLGVFESSVFAALTPGQTHDLADLYGELLARGDLAAFEVAERFWEVGSEAGWQELRSVLR